MNLKEYIDEGLKARQSIKVEEIVEVSEIIYNALKNGKKLVTFGNGGSAADAQHFAAEIAGKFLREKDPLPAVALTTNTSVITAIGNDYSFDEIFSRQVRGIVNEGDVVFGITTSGNSKNVIKGIEEANSKNAYTIALTGRSGGKVKSVAKKTITVESDLTPIIQETHITIIHLICMVLEDMIIKKL